MELIFCNIGDSILVDIEVFQDFQIIGLNTIEKLHFYKVKIFYSSFVFNLNQNLHCKS